MKPTLGVPPAEGGPWRGGAPQALSSVNAAAQARVERVAGADGMTGNSLVNCTVRFILDLTWHGSQAKMNQSVHE
jgi:hypothetical protein